MFDKISFDIFSMYFFFVILNLTFMFATPLMAFKSEFWVDLSISKTSFLNIKYRLQPFCSILINFMDEIPEYHLNPYK